MTRSPRLTPRQLEIIDRLSRPGATQATVAEELGISSQTVKNHLTMVYRTLGVRSFGQAVRIVRNRTAVLVP